jgi:hypothetical protein
MRRSSHQVVAEPIPEGTSVFHPRREAVWQTFIFKVRPALRFLPILSQASSLLNDQYRHKVALESMGVIREDLAKHHV